MTTAVFARCDGCGGDLSTGWSLLPGTFSNTSYNACPTLRHYRHRDGKPRLASRVLSLPLPVSRARPSLAPVLSRACPLPLWPHSTLPRPPPFHMLRCRHVHAGSAGATASVRLCWVHCAHPCGTAPCARTPGTSYYYYTFMALGWPTPKYKGWQMPTLVARSTDLAKWEVSTHALLAPDNVTSGSVEHTTQPGGLLDARGSRSVKGLLAR